MNQNPKLMSALVFGGFILLLIFLTSVPEILFLSAIPYVIIVMFVKKMTKKPMNVFSDYNVEGDV